MAKKLAIDWRVLPHDPIEQLADNLWRVEGNLPNMALRRCMVVARTTSGELALHSAIAMDEEGMIQLESLGQPAYLIVPNGWHCLDAARYKARYPDIKVICPHKARKMVAHKVQRIDGTYDDFSKLDTECSVRLEHFDRDRHVEGAMIVRSSDGLTLAFADSLFNLPHQEGMFWWIYGRLLGSTGGPRVTLIGRAMMTLTRSKRPFREFLRRYNDTGEVTRLVPGHGAVVDENVSEIMEALVRSLA